MKKILYIILIFLFTGCASQENTNAVLSREQMVNVLIDIHLREALVSAQNLTPDTSKIIFRSLEEEIFKKHGIDRQDYESSYSAYLKNIKELDRIYASVVDSLSLRESMSKIK